MALKPERTQVPASRPDSRWEEFLTKGISDLSQLPFAGLPPELARKAEELLSLCHILCFRIQTGNTLPFIGILGNADSGKSTLFNSVTSTNISLVTPIPHQTTGPILSVPKCFQGAADHASLLRPVVKDVEHVSEGTTGLTGNPSSVKVVPSREDEDKPFVLMDLPDIGTVDSREEKQVALRIISWLDRVVLLVTEESFAQADHEEIARALQTLRPERARADLFVVLNRRHAGTDDAAFACRLQKVRDLWPLATISTLPHLPDRGWFSASDIKPITAEASARVSRTLQSALCNLAVEVVADMKALCESRNREQQLLKDRLHTEIRAASRFSRAFFSDEFRGRLDAFSPWRVSVRRIRSFLKKEAKVETPVVDLMAPAPVERHLIGTLKKIHQHVSKHVGRITEAETGNEVSPVPGPDEEAVRNAVSGLVAETNRNARKNVESLLESLQEQHKVKDPGWSLVTAVSSTIFLVDLFIPSVGTLGSMAFAGILSALGFGGIITSDLMRKLRTSQIRESFESGMQEILEQETSRILASGTLSSFLDLTEPSRSLAQWTNSLPEI